jgi:RNA-directed DNA polymerase
MLIDLQWKRYEAEYRKGASHRGLNPSLVGGMLQYAERLYKSGLPIIYDMTHFSYLVGYDVCYIVGACNRTSSFYRTFEIAKRSGAPREIAEPLPSLKEIQKWILENVLENVDVGPFAKAYVKGQSIKKNARLHRAQPIVLRVDIENFFGSIEAPSVFHIFREMGYSHGVSNLLAHLCTYSPPWKARRYLPQGAPTSPALSNLFARRIDRRLGAYALKRNWRYSRYADDMVFSGKLNVGSAISMTRRVLSDHRLVLNDRKTRVMRRHRAQLVTGAVVNEKVQAPRALRRELRQVAHYIEKFGFLDHVREVGMNRKKYLDHLLGQANYVLFLNPKDRDAMKLVELLKRTRSSHSLE